MDLAEENVTRLGVLLLGFTKCKVDCSHKGNQRNILQHSKNTTQFRGSRPVLACIIIDLAWKNAFQLWNYLLSLFIYIFPCKCTELQRQKVVNMANQHIFPKSLRCTATDVGSGLFFLRTKLVCTKCTVIVSIRVFFK